MPCKTITVEKVRNPTTTEITSIPSTVNVGEKFYVEGQLTSGGTGIDGMEVVEYIDGEAETRQLTLPGGNFSFETSISTAGDHQVHVEFPGTDNYQSSSSTTYTITVEPPPGKYTDTQLDSDGTGVWAIDTEKEEWVSYDPEAPQNEISCELAVYLTKDAGLYETWVSNCEEANIDIPCIGE